MKIEQRCGRADRIGQKRDVHIYNLIIETTVENRVRQVLEEKLEILRNACTSDADMRQAVHLTVPTYRMPEEVNRAVS